LPGGATEEGLEADQKDVEIEGLGEVIVGAGFDAFEDLVGTGARGEHEDRGVVLGCAEGADDGEAVGAGEHAVEDDGGDGFIGGEEVDEGRVAVGLVVGAVAFGLEVEEETLGEMVFVFDYDDEGSEFSHGICGVRLRCNLCLGWLRFLQQRYEQVAEPVPCDLNADAEEDEGYDAQDAVGGGGRDGARDFGGVGVAEIDEAAERDGGDEEADVSEDGVGDRWLRGVDGEGEHDDDAAWACGDGKGERIEGFVLQAVDLVLGDGRDGCFSLLGVGGAVFLVQQRPADHRDYDAAGDLHDGKRDAEEGEEGGADEFDDGEEDNCVDGDAAGEGAVGVDWRSADEAEEDERGAEGVDERKKRAEAQCEVFPEKVHGYC